MTRYHLFQGFAKEFGSVRSLVTHHSVMPELLPVPLSLARPQQLRDPSGNFADINDPEYTSIADFRQLMSDLHVWRHVPTWRHVTSRQWRYSLCSYELLRKSFQEIAIWTAPERNSCPPLGKLLKVAFLPVVFHLSSWRNSRARHRATSFIANTILLRLTFRRQ